VSSTLLLAWRFVTYYWGRTVLLAACVSLTFALPVAVQVLVTVYGGSVAARAASSPLVAGAPGSRYDLTISSLYFRGRVPRALDMAAVSELSADGLATPIPLLVRHTARDRPVVGTSYEYFELRGLHLTAGRFPAMLGEAVLGAGVAGDLGLTAGDTLLTDRTNLYDLAQGYPLRMHIAGVLAATGSADDGAVFVDLKTAWVIEGLCHGHRAAEAQAADRVIERREQEIVLDSGVVEFTEITPENIDEFHFHGDPGKLPITAVLVVPRDARARTILKGRYRASASTQLLEPEAVVGEILAFVLQVKRFFDANVLLVAVATTMFLLLVVTLSLRVRQRELDTLFRIGCARGTTLRLVATELALTLLVGLAGAVALGATVVFWVTSTYPAT